MANRARFFTKQLVAELSTARFRPAITAPVLGVLMLLWWPGASMPGPPSALGCGISVRLATDARLLPMTPTDGSGGSGGGSGSTDGSGGAHKAKSSPSSSGSSAAKGLGGSAPTDGSHSPRPARSAANTGGSPAGAPEPRAKSRSTTSRPTASTDPQPSAKAAKNLGQRPANGEIPASPPLTQRKPAQQPAAGPELPARSLPKSPQAAPDAPSEPTSIRPAHIGPQPPTALASVSPDPIGVTPWSPAFNHLVGKATGGRIPATLDLDQIVSANPQLQQGWGQINGPSHWKSLRLQKRPNHLDYRVQRIARRAPFLVARRRNGA